MIRTGSDLLGRCDPRDYHRGLTIAGAPIPQIPVTAISPALDGAVGEPRTGMVLANTELASRRDIIYCNR
jgi:hypothetical protein